MKLAGDDVCYHGAGSEFGVLERGMELINIGGGVIKRDWCKRAFVVGGEGRDAHHHHQTLPTTILLACNDQNEVIQATFPSRSILAMLWCQRLRTRPA
jgi:hypothetical protein